MTRSFLSPGALRLDGVPVWPDVACRNARRLPESVPERPPRKPIAHRIRVPLPGYKQRVKVLVVVSEPISAEDLRSALGAQAADDAEVMVIAPALHTSALRFWMSDADEAIAKADYVQRRSAEQLQREGVSVDVNDTAEGNPDEAIRDALVTFPAERVVLFVHPPQDDRYREAIDEQRLSEELEVPVARFEVAAGAS
jgi:hypothetical protein